MVADHKLQDGHMDVIVPEADHTLGIAPVSAIMAKVLLVDDMLFSLGTLESHFRGRSIQVDTAESGLECLRKTIITVYDIIIINVCMPNINGSVSIHELRETGILQDRTKVVAYTPNTDERSLQRYWAYGFDDYLPKPATKESMDSMLRKMLLIQS